MFCFTSKAALAALAVTFSLEGGLPLPNAAAIPPEDSAPQTEQALPSEAQFLEIESNGYSRFEIDGEEIVARFSGGVDFKYMGYKGHADELVYYHAGQQAIATGEVRFDLGDVQLTSTQANLDVLGGTAELGETVYARLKERGLFLEASFATMVFIPGQPPTQLAEVQAELTGGVHAYSTLGSWLVTDTVALDGPSGKLATNGAFTIALSSEQLNSAQTEAGVEWGATRITGSRAEFSFTRDGLLDSASIDTFRLMNDLGELVASRASLTQTGTADEPLWNVALTGSPVSGEFALGERHSALSCDELAGTFRADGSLQGYLLGNVLLSSDSQSFTGDEAGFNIDSEGQWDVSIPESFVLEFKLAEDQFELGELPGLGGE